MFVYCYVSHGTAVTLYFMTTQVQAPQDRVILEAQILLILWRISHGAVNPVHRRKSWLYSWLIRYGHRVKW